MFYFHESDSSDVDFLCQIESLLSFRDPVIFRFLGDSAA